MLAGEAGVDEPLITAVGFGRGAAVHLRAAQPRLWWLRRGAAAVAGTVALAGLIP